MTHDVLRDLLGVKTEMNNVVVSALLYVENCQPCLDVVLVLSIIFDSQNCVAFTVNVGSPADPAACRDRPSQK